MKNLLAVSFLVLGACALTPEAPSGALEVALSAPGPDGSTYRLPVGAILQLEGSFTQNYPLDLEGASMTLEVPPGSYVPALVYQGFTTTLPLTRVAPDGTVTTVEGTVDLPSSITVAEDDTTELVIRFNVASAGTIVFGHGTVGVSVSVNETQASSYRIGIDVADADVAYATFFASAPPELASILPGPGGAHAAMSLTVQTVGPWTWSSNDTVCAASMASQGSSSGSGAFSQLLAETETSDATACIHSSPSSTELEIRMRRSGSPSSDFLAALGDRSYTFDVALRADFPTARAVFADGVLDLAALVPSGPVSGSVTATLFGSDVGSDAAVFQWYTGETMGTGQITFQGL